MTPTAQEAQPAGTDAAHALPGAGPDRVGPPDALAAPPGGAGAGSRRRGARAHKRGDGEGTIYYDAKAGLWRGELMVGRKADGRRDVRKVSAKARGECQKRLDAVRYQATGGLLMEPHQLTLAHALDEWLRDAEIRGLRPSTRASYGRIVRSYVLPALGRVKLAELRPEHVRRLLADLVARGLSPATVRYARVVVHGALQLALRQERVARNAGARSSRRSAGAPGSPRPRPTRRPGCWTPPERERTGSVPCGRSPSSRGAGPASCWR